MNDQSKLIAIKLVHTLIWLFFVAVIFYVVYSGIRNEITVYTWIGIAFVILEGIVLLIFRMFCPLTLLARNYSDSDRDNFDIYLPNWLARHNQRIFGTLYGLGIVYVLLMQFVWPAQVA